MFSFLNFLVVSSLHEMAFSGKIFFQLFTLFTCGEPPGSRPSSSWKRRSPNHHQAPAPEVNEQQDNIYSESHFDQLCKKAANINR